MEKGSVIALSVVVGAFLLALFFYAFYNAHYFSGQAVRGQYAGECHDSDANFDSKTRQYILDGKDYFKPGYAFVTTDVPFKTYLDRCINSGVLEEQYCVNSTSRSTIRTKCEFGCDITRACRKRAK